MHKTIGVTKLKQHLKSILDGVTDRGTPYVVTRSGRPEAALMPHGEYMPYQELRDTELLDRFNRLGDRLAAQNARFGEEETEAEVRNARDELRGH